jgi:Xaa-Pro aminopeptidase
MPKAVRVAEAVEELMQSPQNLLAESEIKLRQLCGQLASSALAAVQLQRTENIAWLTAGRVDRRVLLPSATGIATILVLRSGDAFYLAPDNEASRLAEEDFAGLPFTAITTPWHTADCSAKIRSLTGDGRIATDIAPEGAALLLNLRASLADAEMERYRWLGRNTAEVTARVLESIEPGITERTMVARVASALLERGIEPSVLLTAVDDRILRYKHAVAQNAKLEHFGMLNLCSRRWGLCVSITRFVHFSPPPQRLAEAFTVATEVNARLLAATKAGATSAELFATASDTYASFGHSGEEQRHHQGGATGYAEREWLATPAGKERVVNNQAFAWNPSVAGAKVEDTVLLRDGAIELLTGTPGLPVVSTKAGDLKVQSAGVLVR